MVWKEVQGLPNGIKAKFNMAKMNNINGLITFNIVASDDDIVLNRMDITFDNYNRRFWMDPYETYPPIKELDKGYYP